MAKKVDGQALALKFYNDALKAGKKPSHTNPKRGESAVQWASDKLADKLNISHDAARDRVKRAVKAEYGTPEVTVIEADNQPLNPNPESPLFRRKAQSLAAELKRTQEDLAVARNIREHALQLGPDHVSPSPWQAVPTSPSGKKETPVLFTSDFQCGEVIKSEDTRGFNEYNFDVFRRRIRHLIEATISIVERHHGGSDHIVYLRGGDSISGSIHDELADTDEGPPPVQCVVLLQEEAAAIKALADAFGRVTVISIPGNHDRTTHKPRSKAYTDHSYETLIQYCLEAQFKNDDRVKFITDKSGDVLFRLHGVNFCLTHGDRMGTSGGMGFAGPTLPVVRGAKKIKAQYAQEGHTVDYVLCGHYHTPVYAGGAICNGSLAGYSEYARARIRAEPDYPSQTLFFVHETYGITNVRHIKVNGRKVGAKSDGATEIE